MLVSLRPDRTGGLAAGAIAGLGFTLLQLPRATHGLVLSLILLIAVFGWLRSVHHSRLILDTPTSRIASASQGYTELFGSGQPLDGQPLLSPVSGLPVLWYRLITEEREGSKWVRKGDESSDDSFLLDDGSGVCAIDPAGAELLVTRKDVLVRGDTRYTQWCLIRHDPLYVLGDFTTLGSLDPARDVSRQVRDLLADWKADHAGLLARFDTNGDGQVDLQEWEAARAEARREITRQQRELDAAPEAHLVRRPEGRRLYLISDLDPKQLGRRYQVWGWIFFTGVLASVAALAWPLPR